MTFAKTIETVADKTNMMKLPAKSGLKKNAVLVTAFALFVCFCLVVSTADAASTHVPKKREIASPAETTTGLPKLCSQNAPCGWAIYVPFTRRIDYFMKNTCDCKHTMACLKADDDLSVNAYVYRCKPKPAVTSVEVMPDELE